MLEDIGNAFKDLTRQIDRVNEQTLRKLNKEQRDINKVISGDKKAKEKFNNELIKEIANIF